MVSATPASLGTVLTDDRLAVVALVNASEEAETEHFVAVAIQPLAKKRRRSFRFAVVDVEAHPSMLDQFDLEIDPPSA